MYDEVKHMNAHDWLEKARALEPTMYDFALWSPDEAIYERIQPHSNCGNCYSVAKTFVSTAIGMLRDEGKLDVSDPILRYFGWRRGMDPKWADVTIDHALRHRIGFDEGFLDIDAEDVSAYPTDDYLSMVFDRPLPLEPGSERHYSDAAFYLLARLVERVSGKDVELFLAERLFRPMHFREYAWSRCPEGHPIGATGLYLRADDAVKLGAMYACGGVFEGRRYVSDAWIRLMYAREYELHPHDPFAEVESPEWMMKGGMYGQALLIHKTLPLSIAWHAAGGAR